MRLGRVAQPPAPAPLAWSASKHVITVFSVASSSYLSRSIQYLVLSKSYSYSLSCIYISNN